MRTTRTMKMPAKAQRANNKAESQGSICMYTKSIGLRQQPSSPFFKKSFRSIKLTASSELALHSHKHLRRPRNGILLFASGTIIGWRD